MKNILIIADGILAKHFLERVMSAKIIKHHYTIVTYRSKTLPGIRHENFTFYSFDPTSYEKLSHIMRQDFYQAMILMTKKIDALPTYTNLRSLSPKIQIFLMDLWGMEDEKIEDSSLNIVDARKIISTRFMDFFPDTPVVAQNVGLGIGEVMEIQVPVGSSYVYRHISSILQRKWRIVMIYRNQSYILARPSLMIQPNDVLLIVGEPNVLQNIFKSLDQEIGQFPSPFGTGIYCFVDMKRMKENDIQGVLNDSILLHSKLNNKRLHIKVINPKFSELFAKIKKLNSNSINVTVDYFNTETKNVILEDSKNLNIGLAIVCEKFFKSNKELLYSLKLPILKIGKWGFANLKTGVVLGDDTSNIEKYSSIVLDCCLQLELKTSLYHYDPNNKADKIEIEEHYKNLSKLFKKEVDINFDNTINPIIKLKNRKDLLQFVPFIEDLTKNSLLSIFSTNLDESHYMLANNYQIFIPIETQNEKEKI